MREPLRGIGTIKQPVQASVDDDACAPPPPLQAVAKQTREMTARLAAATRRLVARLRWVGGSFTRAALITSSLSYDSLASDAAV
jgi:hypothetical protein